MSSKPSGTLYACGCANGKQQNFLPLASGVDNQGHCPFPQPVVFPVKGLKFVKAAADMGVFAALDTSGGLWVWGIAHDTDLTEKPRQIASGVVDFDVGARFLIALDGETKQASIYGRHSTAWPNKNFSTAIPLGGCATGLTMVAACCETVLGLSTEGQVYGMGTALNNGLGKDHIDASWAPLEGLPPCVFITLGSRHGAAISADRKLWQWGDGLSGALGDGKRHTVKTPQVLNEDRWNSETCFPVHVGCTRGQPDCKRTRTKTGINGGQEGQRTHVTTSDGSLWVAGTTHKGMGADHMNKTMQPDEDHLTFYKVGGKAVDWKKTPIPTGAAEDFKDQSMSDLVAQRMGMKELKDYGERGCTGYLSDVTVVSSQPVHIHSLALASNGRAFMWGCGSDGRTGLQAFLRGPGGSKRTMKCYVSTPSAVESLFDKKIVYATAGRWWSLFIVDE